MRYSFYTSWSTKNEITLNNRVCPFLLLMMLFIFFVCQQVVAAPQNSSPNILQVGPNKTFIFPSIAATFAKDGDIIEIDADGMYLMDHVRWTQNNLTIRGVGGRAKMASKGLIKNGKAIWVVTGNNVTIENIAFSGARVSDRNGAGIRHEGSGLIIRNCLFEDNQNGVQTSHVSDSEVVIERSEFRNNGFGDGKTHNMYIGKIKSFTLKYSYSHHAIVGHNVKSRAKNNYILYNRIMDEDLGRSSYAIDLPNGGYSVVMGNIIQQGEKTDNSSIIAYGMEGLDYSKNVLHLIHNTIVNDRSAGTFLKVTKGAQAFVANNIFAGRGEMAKGKVIAGNNLMPDEDPKFISRKSFNYQLQKKSPAINQARSTLTESGSTLNPEFEYVHPMGFQPRTATGIADMGAYEYSN